MGCIMKTTVGDSTPKGLLQDRSGCSLLLGLTLPVKRLDDRNEKDHRVVKDMTAFLVPWTM